MSLGAFIHVLSYFRAHSQPRGLSIPLSDSEFFNSNSRGCGVQSQLHTMPGSQLGFQKRVLNYSMNEGKMPKAFSRVTQPGSSRASSSTPQTSWHSKLPSSLEARFENTPSASEALRHTLVGSEQKLKELGSFG